MAIFDSFWAGFAFFIICCIIGFLLSYGGGKIVDEIHQKALDAGVLKDDASMNDYQAGTQGTLYFFINYYYLLCYIIPVFGAIVFGQSIVKRVRTSQYTYRG